MARPLKKGLDYFPLDIGWFGDEKLIDVQNNFGPLGEVIYIRLLCLIYKNGYYYEFESMDRLSAMLIRSIGNRWVRGKHTVEQVILQLAESNLFDMELVLSGVLTSVGVQRRYLKAVERRQCNIDKYWLLEKTTVQAAGESTPQSKKKSAETEVSAYNNQVIVDKKCVNKSKLNTTTTCFLSSRTREEKEEGCVPPSLTEVFAYFNNVLRVEESIKEARAFFLKNEEQWGWSCLPNWKAAAELWCIRGEIETDAK